MMAYSFAVRLAPRAVRCDGAVHSPGSRFSNVDNAVVTASVFLGGIHVLEEVRGAQVRGERTCRVVGIELESMGLG